MNDHPSQFAVSGLYQEWIKAWNRRDASGMARLVAPDGVIIGFDGSQMTGPDDVASSLGDVFAHHPTTPYVSIVRETRVLGEGVVLLRAVVGMPGPDGTAVDPAVNAVHSLVAVRQDGEWKIALFQNTPAALHGRPEAVQALTGELNRALNG